MLIFYTTFFKYRGKGEGGRVIKTVTIKDVARKAGVSPSTVSQFVNKRYHYMGEKTKKKVAEAIEELGFHPNTVARSLKQKKTLTIGVIISNILHRYSTVVSRSIEDYCYNYEYHTIICNADDDPEKEQKYVEMLLAKQIDGLIVVPTNYNRELYQRLKERNIPVVFLDRYIDDLEIPTVVVDNQKITEQAINHWIEAGHRRISLITAPLKVSTRRERVEGYKQALQQADIPINDAYLHHVEMDDVFEVCKEMLELEEPPTAILAASDLVLIELVKFIKQQHIQVPEDLAVMVFDEVHLAELHEPPITTINQPFYEMGQKAASLLMDLIDHKPVEDKKYVFEATINIRESSETKILDKGVM
ncbi:LacI family DNA-binding transcriptional regulator [Virgibacillus senegalensis]|uniref:LacI family DNA-binding transcriptional regulator n=1 Tax=Virgibacillus senegalensis TaxID=1499679 RepID=UPI0022789534|nr:substrate-binding domain-containing protein [Virgibacillus senegalensis]